MKTITLAATLCFGLFSTMSQAATFAVFGDNEIDDFINGISGFTATLVSDSELATDGFLDSFDAFVYTRDGLSFGTSLSSAAAANVQTFVTGNSVLLNADFADAVAFDGNVQSLLTNALDFSVSGAGGGYIGEFTGAAAAFDSNSDGLEALGLFEGDAGTLGFAAGGSATAFSSSGIPFGDILLDGVVTPDNPGAVEFGSAITGFDPANVVAAFEGGNPAILAQSTVAPVPLPAAAPLLAGGLALLGFIGWRRCKRAA